MTPEETAEIQMLSAELNAALYRAGQMLRHIREEGLTDAVLATGPAPQIPWFVRDEIDLMLARYPYWVKDLWAEQGRRL